MIQPGDCHHKQILYRILVYSTDSLLLIETSHRKLLMQVEEVIETLLNDAQRKITATHEASLSFFLTWNPSYVLMVVGIVPPCLVDLAQKRSLGIRSSFSF